MIKVLQLLAASTLLMSAGAIAQDAPPNAPPPAAEATTPPQSPDPSSSASSTMTLSEAEAKAWIGKTVYSSDDKNVGEIAALERDASGKVKELHADIGGFLGIGETRVRVMPSEFKIVNDRVILAVNADQASKLPRVTAN